MKIEVELFTGFDIDGEEVYHEVSMYKHYLFGLFTKVSSFRTDSKLTHSINTFRVQTMSQRY